MSTTVPLYVGAEETLVVAAAHSKGEPKLNLANCSAHVDALLEQGLGKLYVIRGYGLHPDADPGDMLWSKRCVTDDPDGDLVKLFEYAAKRGVYTMTIYTNMTGEVVAALKERCGPYYLGNNMGEVTHSGVPAGKADMAEATRAWVDNIRNLTQAQWDLGQPHVTCTLTNFFAKYCMEAGMDIATAEIFTVPCVDVQYALLRGAARAYGRDMFGGWLATGWFSGSNRDPLKPGRWRLALNASFMHGSNMLIQESGHWGLYEFRDFADEDAPLPRQYRAIQREFVDYAASAARPVPGPDVRVGLVHGNLDGYAGTEGLIWGQAGWLVDDHDKGWELLNVFYPEAGRICDNSGMQDRRRSRFSGTPYGLADIVPGEASAEALSRYGSVLFLGWNTMTDAQYRDLIDYVRGGGRLVMWASHLNGSARREDLDMKHKFYADGDFMDLFGARVHIPITKRRTWRDERTMLNVVRWTDSGAHGFPVGKVYYNNWPHGGVASELADGVRVLAETERGFPFVTEHRLGQGTATLVHCYSPQGQCNYRELAEDIYHAVGKAELADFRVEGNARLSYGVYGRGEGRCLYVCNTDLENPQSGTVVGLSGDDREIQVAPAGIERVDWR